MTKTKTDQRVDAMLAQRDRLKARLEAAQVAVTKAEKNQGEALASADDKRVDQAAEALAKAQADAMAIERAIEVAEAELEAAKKAAAEEAEAAERERVVKALNKAGSDLAKAAPVLDQLKAAVAEASSALNKALPADFMPVRVVDDNPMGVARAMSGRGREFQNQAENRRLLIGAIICEQVLAGAPDITTEVGIGKIGLPLTDLDDGALFVKSRSKHPAKTGKAIADHFAAKWKERAERVQEGTMQPVLDAIEPILVEKETAFPSVISEKPFAYWHPDSPHRQELVQASMWTPVPRDLLPHLEGIAFEGGTERGDAIARTAMERREHHAAMIAIAELGDRNVIDLGNPLEVEIEETPNPWEVAREKQGRPTMTYGHEGVAPDHPLRANTHQR